MEGVNQVPSYLIKKEQTIQLKGRGVKSPINMVSSTFFMLSAFLIEKTHN